MLMWYVNVNGDGVGMIGAWLTQIRCAHFNRKFKKNFRRECRLAIFGIAAVIFLKTVTDGGFVDRFFVSVSEEVGHALAKRLMDRL